MVYVVGVVCVVVVVSYVDVCGDGVVAGVAVAGAYGCYVGIAVGGVSDSVVVEFVGVVDDVDVVW